MALLGIAAAKAQRREPIFTAEISPPRLYLEIDRIVGIARRLRALGLDAIAVTTSDLVRMVDGYRRGTLLDGSQSEPLPHLDILVAAHPEYPPAALPKHFRF